ncbi:metallophosphoesterase [Methylomonas sp. OY6]|uniref:Metallophosphoesterase n=1 Tax=Methylomonas defluvii TaxID=3045149 RepID=A0ABU4UB51_9GAMM|nr:metallophosphoesterase [Methylomonas sp. OY6]MDX8126680.1 metallophosphoesterase [Methylomonas sp. OY6]
MKTKLTWLHISDIHFHPNTEWRDNSTRDNLITYLQTMFVDDPSLRPDLIFCTGDIAFGETRSSQLADQYNQAKEFFSKLLTVCGQEGKPLPDRRLFVVPGNHDVNRNNINNDAQETLNRWAEDASAHINKINQRFNDCSPEFKDAVKRLDEYALFVKEYLPHQTDNDGRHSYSQIVDIDDLKVGLAGFNSAWSCSGPEDDRAIWLAAEYQFNQADLPIKNADIRIGLIHHPVDWLNTADRDIATRRISTDFHFWLHGHVHNQWLDPGQNHITFAAGAVGAEVSEEFGINLVQIDLSTGKGVTYLHEHRRGGKSWKVATIEEHAPSGKWPFDLPDKIKRLAEPLPPPTTPSANTGRPIQTENAKQIFKLYGRDKLLQEAVNKLKRLPFLLVYGLRGNGKSKFIEALGQKQPLASKELHRFSVSRFTTADEVFRQIATLLGETAEFPEAPKGDSATIAAEISRRYANPRSAWIWIENAHHLIDREGFRDHAIGQLLSGLQAALGVQWHWLLELRERPPKHFFANIANDCEITGLDKTSIQEWFKDAAPPEVADSWSYSGDELKRIYQWLGGGHGGNAHTLATQLLIQVACELAETPLQVLQRHRDRFEDGIDNLLLDDLYHKVLSDAERKLMQTFALYRSGIPHDHVEMLEQELNIAYAWDGLDRRLLVSSNAEHSVYFLHSFIASWVRNRQLGYVDQDEDNCDGDLQNIDEVHKALVRQLHAAIANCWLEQLGRRTRISNLNISRAVEAFHHLTAADLTDQIQTIAVELITGNLDWAWQRIQQLNDYLYKINAPVKQQCTALEYALRLKPDFHKYHRFLGECWLKEEGPTSQKALECFQEACRLNPGFAPYWANLGKVMSHQGYRGAKDFLERLAEVENNYPQAINDFVLAVKADCLDIVGEAGKASELRLECIEAGSKNAAFYTSEAKARLDAGDVQGALDFLEKAKQNRCANDYTDAILADALQATDPARASQIRMKHIEAGSKNAAFYNSEAKARLDAGDVQGALDVLEKAKQNRCADDYTDSIMADALQATDPARASQIRMKHIEAGSKNAAFYTSEAKARLDAGDVQGALDVLEKAKQNRCANDYTDAILADALQATDPERARTVGWVECNETQH